jgi:polysaccharide export outer membrane protein
MTMMQIISGLAFIVLAALSVGIQAQQTTFAGNDGANDARDGYLIGPEDVLDVSVWKEDGLKKELLVRPDGGVSFPLVGDLKAAGKTAVQLQTEIVARLSKYIPDPIVSVSILKVASNKVYVLGKVNKPGEYLTGRYIDVLQALSLAGGLTPFASENGIKIIRKENGKETVLPFQYGKVQSGAGLEQNVQLKSGDVILVP